MSGGLFGGGGGRGAYYRNLMVCAKSSPVGCRETTLQVQVMDPQKLMKKKTVQIIILTSSYSSHLPFLPEHVIILVQKPPGKHQACNH